MQLTLEVVLDGHASQMLAECVHLFFRQARHRRVLVYTQRSEDACRREVGNAVERQEPVLDFLVIRYLYTEKKNHRSPRLLEQVKYPQGEQDGPNCLT